MQNRYFGDVGDFGKYGLLRILSGLDGEVKLRLGVVWYLFPDEGHNADGKHIGYLQRNDLAFRQCDEHLFDRLRELLFDDLGYIESNRLTRLAAGLLPEGTIFYNEPLSYSAALPTAQRIIERQNWFVNALATTAAADLVFLDPDNGIECASVKRTSGKGPKYVFCDEIDAFVQRGQNVVVYHHLNRTGSHLSQVEDKLKQITTRYGAAVEGLAVTYTRGTGRAYLVITAPQHADLLKQRIQKTGSGHWSRHFILNSQKALGPYFSSEFR